jgi:hypothetical protein
MAESANAASATTAAAGPDAGEVRGWVGSRLDEIGGVTVAKIDGFLVDERTGRPEWLVVRPGRFGHHALVPAREAVEAAGRTAELTTRGFEAITARPAT